MQAINKHIAVVLFLLTVSLSLLSQLPVMLDSGASNILKLVWILPFCFLLLTSPQLFLSNKMQPFYIFVFAMVLYCFACHMATGNTYFGPDINNFAISLLVTLVSYIFWKQYGSPSVMQGICIVMLICGILLSFQIYFDYLRDADIMSNTYAYENKNSIAQILLCCATTILMFYRPKDKRITIISYILVALMLIVMIMTKSRATLVSALYIVYYFTFKYLNRKTRIIIIAISTLALAYITLNADIYKVIMEGIVMGGRDASDINSLSSNRILLFGIALKLIPQHPWIGSGDYYVDCMPLNILTEFGIIGLTVVVLFLLHLYRQLNKQRKNDKIRTTAYVLFIAFLLNALFEAQPPFGPGMKCFILWMFVGFSFAKTNNIKLNEASK